MHQRGGSAGDGDDGEAAEAGVGDDSSDDGSQIGGPSDDTADDGGIDGQNVVLLDQVHAQVGDHRIGRHPYAHRARCKFS